MTSIQTTLKRAKPYLRWFILALTLGFILHTLRENWQQVLTIRFTGYAIAKLLLALGVTLLAHIWSGWVWYWIMQVLRIPLQGSWAVIVYLKTNLGKYLPGNIWHFAWRIHALTGEQIPLGVAITGVVLEPVLMAVAALLIAIISLPTTLLQAVVLVGLLVLVHPRVLNPVLKRLATKKIKQVDFGGDTRIPALTTYPLKPLIGEIGFVVLRGIGFILCFAAIGETNWQIIWTLLGAFSFSWLLGLVVPGAPGGIGVFEATALTLLSPTLPPAIVLGAVALYRLNGTLAEIIGASLAVLDERWNVSLLHRQTRQESSH